MTIDPEIISSFLLISSSFLGAFIAALWIAIVIWTYRDIRTRSRDTFVYLLATILVALLSLPGVLIYLIVRPHRTLEDEYQGNLEEEALLSVIENQLRCPGCGRNLKSEWIICPTCFTKIQKSCKKCGNMMELAWTVCPYCGTTTAGLREDHTQQKNEERSLSD